MDVQSLSVLFATTYNPDPNVRKAGELEIRKVCALVTAMFGQPVFKWYVIDRWPRGHLDCHYPCDRQ